MFSNVDNTVHIFDPDQGEVTKLVSSPVLRYSNFNAHCTSCWVLAVEEDHQQDTPAQVKNYVVAINGDTGEVKRVISGADFYYTPQFSPDGAKVAWLEWDHPLLPFASAKLKWSAWLQDAVVDHVQAPGGDKVVGAVEPRWGPDGSLYYGQEVNGYRQLFHLKPDTDVASHVQLDGLENTELGQIIWWQGRYVFWIPRKHGRDQLLIYIVKHTVHYQENISLLQ